MDVASSKAVRSMAWRFAWVAIAASTTITPASTALAQNSMPRAITLVVPLAAGGGVDTVGRVLAERLQEKLRVPVVVENRVGAGGIIGIESVAKAEPDGSTILLLESSATLHKWLHQKVAFDVVTDFAPIALAVSTPMVLFANASVPARSPTELIEYARANPGKLSVATPGIGSPHHLTMLMMNAISRINIAHVPYRGTAPGLNDLVGGQIPLMWATPIAAMPQVEAGKIRAIGVASSAPVASLPGIEPMAKAVPGLEMSVWFGVAAPARTNPAMLQKFREAFAELLDDRATRARLEKLGFDVTYRDAQAFGTLIAADHERFGKVVRETGIGK